MMRELRERRWSEGLLIDDKESGSLSSLDKNSVAATMGYNVYRETVSMSCGLLDLPSPPVFAAERYSTLVKQRLLSSADAVCGILAC